MRCLPTAARSPGSSPFLAGPADSAPPDGPATTPDSGVELWVAPVDGGQGVRDRLDLDHSGRVGDSPLWSPDGRLIAFVTFVTDDATGERRRTAIEVVAADGSDRRRLTTRPGLLEDGMSWSPDGRYLAYVAAADPSSVGADRPAAARHSMARSGISS